MTKDRYKRVMMYLELQKLVIRRAERRRVRSLGQRPPFDPDETLTRRPDGTIDEGDRLHQKDADQ